MADEIISRAEAKARGLTRYFTGQECANGHVAERAVSNAGCTECQRAYRPRDVERERERQRARAAAYASRNPEKIKARSAAYLAANREQLKAKKRAHRAANAEKIKAARAVWYAANPEKEKARRGRYLAANREKEKERKAAWAKANPEKVNASNRNRKARFIAAEGSHAPEDIKRIYQAQNCKCALCRVKLNGKYHVDHIQALTNGGSNWPRNLQLLCAPCNNKKYIKDPIEFARELGFLL